MSEKKERLYLGIWALCLVVISSCATIVYLTKRATPRPPSVLDTIEISAEPLLPLPSAVPKSPPWHSIHELAEAAGTWYWPGRGVLKVMSVRVKGGYTWWFQYRQAGDKPLECALVGGSRAIDIKEPHRAVWWAGYCHGLTLAPGPDHALEIQFERAGTSLRLSAGNDVYGPFERGDAGE